MDAESSDYTRHGKERAGHKSKSATMEEIWSESQQMVRRQRSGCRTTDRDRGPWRIFSTRW